MENTYRSNTLGVPGTAVIYCYTDSPVLEYAAYWGYEMSLDYRFAPIPVTQADNTMLGVRIGWNGVAGAEAYMVLGRTAGSSAWTELEIVKGTSYVWNEAVSGVQYDFAVRCVSTQT